MIWQTFAIHGNIPEESIENFKGKVTEGSVYKVWRFQVAPAKPTHNSVLRSHMLYFNEWTKLQEITEGIESIPRYYFDFASSRNEKNPHLTGLVF